MVAIAATAGAAGKLDPHGDVAAQITLPAGGYASGLDEWTDADEYGNAINGTPVGATATNSPGGDPTARPGYGWLGTHQRPTQSTGMVQMGARLYNPATGTFTSTDPVYGGNTTAYDYPTDPIDSSDVKGRCLLCDVVNHIVSFGVNHAESMVNSYVNSLKNRARILREGCTVHIFSVRCAQTSANCDGGHAGREGFPNPARIVSTMVVISRSSWTF